MECGGSTPLSSARVQVSVVESRVRSLHSSGEPHAATAPGWSQALPGNRSLLGAPGSSLARAHRLPLSAGGIATTT